MSRGTDLATGRVVFPLAYADHLKAIKLGSRSYQEVSAEIEDLLVRVEQAAAVSELREEPDRAYIDATVCEVYGREVRS